MKFSHTNKLWCLKIYFCSSVLFAYGLKQPNIWPYNIETVRPPAGLQSPINIPTSLIKTIAMPPLKYNDIANKNSSEIVKCENDGKSLVCSLLSGTRPSIEGGPLPGKYIFQNTHWHWGRDNSYGSEHMINGKRYPSEMHAVFFREEYGNVMEAMKHIDGLGILAFLADVSATDTDNPDLELLFNDAAYMTTVGSKVEHPWNEVMVFLNNLVLKQNGVVTKEGNQNWLTYPGALTAPPYYWESAIWMVYSQVIPMSTKQIGRFRELRALNNQKNVEHTREVFPLNGRPLYMRCKNCENSGSAPGSAPSTAGEQMGQKVDAPLPNVDTSPIAVPANDQAPPGLKVKYMPIYMPYYVPEN